MLHTFPSITFQLRGDPGQEVLGRGHSPDADPRPWWGRGSLRGRVPDRRDGEAGNKKESLSSHQKLHNINAMSFDNRLKNLMASIALIWSNSLQYSKACSYPLQCYYLAEYCSSSLQNGSDRTKCELKILWIKCYFNNCYWQFTVIAIINTSVVKIATDISST